VGICHPGLDPESNLLFFGEPERLKEACLPDRQVQHKSLKP